MRSLMGLAGMTVGDLYEFNVWAEGECRDADGNLLDSEGNIIDQAEDQPEPEES